MILLFDHRVRFALLAVLIIAATVLASCGNEGGMYQGGSDSEPGWK